MTAAPLLRLTGVTRRHGERTVLSSLDLTVHAGERVAVMGANGSGKSTLLRIAVGHDRPSEGTVTFDGRPVDDTDARVRSRIAVVSGTPAFYPDLTVGEHLQLVAVAHGAGRDSAARVAEALDRTRLTGLADRLPASLSSGQAQQLLLAAALVRPRDLLVLDEPEQRLDPDAREELAARLREEGAAGTAVLFATHDQWLADSVADRLVVLDEGVARDEGRFERDEGRVLSDEGRVVRDENRVTAR